MALDRRGFRIPLRRLFRGHTHRQGALLEGPSGWGECSPFPGYSDAMVANCVEAARSAAFEQWPPAVRDRIEVHVTIPALPPEEAAALVRRSGCRAAKVKVAEGDDAPRLEAVRDALGPSGRLTVDANGAWDLDEAIRQIKTFRRYGVDLVEQPVAGIFEMARLRRMVEVPLAADELVTSAESAARVGELGAADVLVVKVQNLGGVGRALRAIEAAGLPVIVSSLLETSIGVAAGLALAAALPELPFPCGLGTVPLLEGDVAADPLVPVDGQLAVRRPPVDLEALRPYEIDPSLILETVG